MPASRGFLLILLPAVFVALTGCPSDEEEPAFKQADLTGQWRYTILFAGPSVETGAPGWARGTFSLDAAGAATLETYADSSGATTVPVIPPITYALDADGVVTATTTAFTNLHGKMNPAKTFFVTTATQGAGAAARMRLGIAQRIVAGTPYGAADLASTTFAFRQLGTGAAPSWLRGRIVVGADRVYSLVNLVDSSGAQGDVPNQGTLSVDGSGVVTTTVSPSFGGFVSADKQVMIGTQMDAPNAPALTAVVRSATGFAQADITGAWHYLNLATTIGAAGWAHGTVSFDGAGIGTFGPQVDSSGGAATPPSITLSVASDGNVTQTAPAPSVFSGILTPAKDVMIATETHEAGVYGIIVAIR